MPDDPPPRVSIVLFSVLLEGSLAGVAWALGWLVRQPPLEHCDLNLSDALVGVGAALPLLLLFLVFQRSPWAPFVRIRSFFDDVIQPFFASCTLFDLALISIAAGAGEEMLFRGVIQAALARWLGSAAGLILASVLFGLLHPITLTYVIVASAMGAYLGLVWLWTGDLLVAMVAHAVYDFLALALLMRTRAPGRPVVETDAACNETGL